MKTSLNIGFRTYAIGVLIGALLTAVALFDVYAFSMTMLGAVWVVLAIFGGVVAVGMTTKKEVVLVDDQTGEQKERFETTDLTGLPLSVYFVSAAVWSGVSAGWTLGGQSVDTLFTIGYGWLAIAAYGAVLGVGIAVRHSTDITEAVSPNGEMKT
jgi:hypothetical protein